MLYILLVAASFVTGNVAWIVAGIVYLFVAEMLVAYRDIDLSHKESE